ncbi:MAG: DEAD/DEAH box helicase [Lachnospiraceae bacterium]|nr:DEAD/DEAH box helicase [Lachnospiraceae bacterium]
MKAEERRQYRDFAETVSAADRELRLITEQYAERKKEVRQLYRALRETLAVDLLTDADIEELNSAHEGIRVKAFRDHGIRTVADVCRNSLWALQSVPGVGPVMAEKAKRNADAIRIAAGRKVRVQFDRDRNLVEQSRLLVALIKLMHARMYGDNAIRLYEASHEGIQVRLKISECVGNAVSWFFSGSEKKQQALLAYDELTEYVRESYAAEASSIISGFKQAVIVMEAEAWDEFYLDPAAVYAFLFSVTEGSTEAQTDYGGIPGELVEAVNAVELKTDGLKADLRRYQVFGTKYILYGKRVLLGDEMGLGKTIEAIAAMTHLRAEGKTHFLVVCPLSVLVNWKREVARFSDILVDEIYGGDRTDELDRWIECGGTAITTYETASKIDLPNGFSTDMLVIDEAQYVKNTETLRSRAVRHLIERSDRVLMMSGTPLENRVSEMVSLIGCLQPEVAARVKDLTGVSNAERFRNEIAPVYLRRTREQVLTELPEKEEIQEWGAMTPEEEEAYIAALETNNFMEVRKVSWNVSETEHSTKMQRLLELTEEAEADGRKVIVFSFFRNTLKMVDSALGSRSAGVIDGSMPMKGRQQLLDSFKNDPKKTVLICQVIAGGVGLNVQEASVIIFCEPQLKPSMEEQAIGRAYRMGQSRKVTVHRLLMADTVDERILAVLEGKKEEFDAFANESVVGRIDLEREIGAAVADKIMEEEKKRYQNMDDAEPEE